MRAYTAKAADYPYGASRGMGNKNILLQRTKTIKAGDYLECEIFPVVEMTPGIRARRHKPTREAQRAVNLRNAQKGLWRVLNANFTQRDYMLDLTTEEWMEEGDMIKKIRKFTGAMRELAGEKDMPCKYVYVIEITGQGEERRFHVHMVMNRGFCTFDDIEKYWPHGSTKLRSVRKFPGGLRAFSLYITKNKATQERLLKKRWACSRNLKHPVPTVSSCRFSRRESAKLAQAVEADARRVFEKKYPGYRLIWDSVEVRYSDWLPGAYIYAMMEKIPERKAA